MLAYLNNINAAIEPIKITGVIVGYSVHRKIRGKLKKKNRKCGISLNLVSLHLVCFFFLDYQ